MLLPALSGFALVAGIRVYAAIQAGALPDVTSSRLAGLWQELPLARLEESALLVATGLLLYLTGLFAPLRGREGPT